MKKPKEPRSKLSKDGTRLKLTADNLDRLPESVANLTGLTELDLSGNRLTVLPDWLGTFTKLTKLDLSRNRLTVLPDWLGTFTKLTQLNLNANQLEVLPECLRNLSMLRDLVLEKNRISTLPDWIGDIGKLANLYLNDNQLGSLPESLCNLTELSWLVLNNNKLTALPEGLGNLHKLTGLFLINNKLDIVPDSLGSLTNLRRINLGGNRLTVVPEGFGNLVSLTGLMLGRNRLTSLPESLRKLTSLEDIYLYDNQLTYVPDWLCDLSSLDNLSLDNNQLSALPESLGKLTALTQLGLIGNQLTALPESLGKLTALAKLSLDNNQLSALPESLGKLTALTQLGLSGNQLTALPESLGKLTALAELSLNGNQLTALPESLGNLIELTALDLVGNPLESPLLEIAEDGTAAVKAYLALSMEHSGELWKSKMLVVGEGSVGKTSVLKALAREEHDPHEPTTHGIRIVELGFDHPHLPDVRMCLSSWDFGGQDIYHATHQFFLSDRSLFLLLWNSRQGWEQANLSYWLDIIKARAPHSRVILVATRGEGRPIDLPLKDLQISFPQIVASMSVDNSTGEGIDELRETIAGQAAELPLMGSRWPMNWLTGLEAISALRQQHATPEELCRRLREVGVIDASHQFYLLRTLHILGDILYFDEDEELRDTIILRPQWVNGYVARVLDSPEVAEKHGLLTRPHERQLWSDLELSLRDRFLLLMEKFDLSYRITDDSSAASLVVERLPWDNPNYLDRWDDAMQNPEFKEIRLRYQLSTFPPGVPTWFIAREHRFTTNTHWRNGALLQHTGDGRVLGLIRADRKDKTVDLAVRGPVPHFFFSVLQDGFESTLRRYQGLEITRLVPCKCARGIGTQLNQPCKHLYQYEPLLRRVEKNVSEVECELSFSKVSVADLLFGIAPTTTEKLMNRLDQIDQNISEFRSEAAWAQREFLKNLRRNQARLEALCPTIFTLTPTDRKVRRPGIHRLELRLYCEQPGAFHCLPEAPYIIDQPTRWLVALRPYLVTILSMLKHAAPLVGPVLGLTAEHLAKQLSSETELMNVLIDQLPEDLDIDSVRLKSNANENIKLDADCRALYALLHQLDPTDSWAGLSRTYTPEGNILWLCRAHAAQ